jgi:glutaredoxin-related protein
MRKKRKPTGECRDCAEAKELIARYVGGDEDDELARKVLLHAQSCGECATLLRSLKRLVHYCSLEPTCEMPVAVRRELWVTIRREIHTRHSK